MIQRLEANGRRRFNPIDECDSNSFHFGGMVLKRNK
ncbi:hypothetical protein AALP_AA3G273000 [Arabis alpina]|uniref:Uncharacterized protein n=1 Tax=Arabis alpina TaxID=50452 RepID=A0A087HC09_ARAAL|nr:hypothetical protein AALP_AA3G273000 [Arabis alpina]